ncbi:MAG: FecR domain-containing protein [Deltaproteobacteria bacterium]|nr:FecR domain-containing protein [Deltaproteobacteria bacterium]
MQTPRDPMPAEEVRRSLQAAPPPFTPAARARIVDGALARVAKRQRRPWLVLLPAAAALAGLVALLLRPAPELGAPFPAAAGGDLIPIGEVVAVAGLAAVKAPLADGERPARAGNAIDNHSTVTTGAGSGVEILFDRRFRIFFEAQSQGEVSYRGVEVTASLTEGAIVVHVDARRPFEELQVQAGPVTVAVRGTRFRVERHAAEVTVALESGALQVRGPGQPSLSLAAGQQVRFGAAPVAVSALLPEIAAEIRAPRAPTPSRQPGSPAPAPTGAVRDPPPAVSPAEARPDPYALARARFFDRDYEGTVQVLAVWLATLKPGAEPRARLLLADALRLSHRDGEALTRYEELQDAERSVAEPALFEAVRLKLTRGDLLGALTDCGIYRRRFPAGVLLPEITEVVLAHADCGSAKKFVAGLSTETWSNRTRAAAQSFAERCP